MSSEGCYVTGSQKQESLDVNLSFSLASLIPPINSFAVLNLTSLLHFSSFYYSSQGSWPNFPYTLFLIPSLFHSFENLLVGSNLHQTEEISCLIPCCVSGSHVRIVLITLWQCDPLRHCRNVDCMKTGPLGPIFLASAGH